MKKNKILELGCGSCANLCILAREGFDAYGIDLSEEGLSIGEQVLSSWNVAATLQQGDMRNLPYNNIFLNCVVDVFPMYCLDRKHTSDCLQEVSRVKKNKGKFFFYTPSACSDIFKKSDNQKIEEYTLNAFLGNEYPFRFWPYEKTEEILIKYGLSLIKQEKISRTYNNGKEYFEFISAEAIKL